MIETPLTYKQAIQKSLQFCRNRQDEAMRTNQPEMLKLLLEHERDLLNDIQSGEPFT